MRTRRLELGAVVVLAFALGGPATAHPGTGPCSVGGTPLQQRLHACTPTDCVSLQLLDWGFGGVPPGVIQIPKHDSNDGELIGVELTYKLQFVGDVCVDNLSPSCCTAAMDAAILSFAAPGVNNDPPVTSLAPFQLDGSRELTPAGFLLGSADGVTECFGTLSGNPSVGDCTPGEDHFIAQWDVEYQTPLQALTDPADLLPWIRSAGTPANVEFDTTAIGTLVGIFCASMSQYRLLTARVWFEVTYTYCRPGTGYCSGDQGSGTPCPCGNDNDGSVPGAGCANATFPSGAHLLATGSASLGADSLVLVADGVDPLTSGLFFQGNDRVAGGAGLAFGDGLLCAGGNIVRLQVRVSTAAGNVQTSIPLAVAGGVAAGETKRYQYWYRTSSPVPCGGLVNGFNTTNGYELAWAP